MKYALVIIESKDILSGSMQALQNFANKVETSGIQSPKAQRLNPGAYLLPLEHGLTFLSSIVSLAKEYELSFRTLFFDHDPPWVIS